jgi:nucleoside-diphosphate-sugar epimerase
VPIPTVAPDEAALEEQLSQPTPALVDSLRALPGDLLVLGAGGKMGPSLTRLAHRGWKQAGSPRRVIAVARFSAAGIREALERDGIETIGCDLLDREQLARLPDAPNLIYMVGQKFGTTGNEARTWVLNAYVPALVAERFPEARIVAFSTGNVYPLAPTQSPGPAETDPTGPIGEYAESALARERVLEFFSRRNHTPMAFLRLNYAIEPRYGVLRDIADRVWSGEPVELSTGMVNVIWQRDANAVALRALGHCAVPPLVLNVTGRPASSVRWLAERFGSRWGKTPRFQGREGATALLSDSTRMEALFGPLEVGIETMIAAVADWVERGGRSLGKPTHFEQREGRF